MKKINLRKMIHEELMKELDDKPQKFQISFILEINDEGGYKEKDIKFHIEDILENATIDATVQNLKIREMK